MYYLFRPYIVSNDFSITTIRRVKMVVKDQLNSFAVVKAIFLKRLVHGNWIDIFYYYVIIY